MRIIGLHIVKPFFHPWTIPKFNDGIVYYEKMGESAFHLQQIT